MTTDNEPRKWTIEETLSLLDNCIKSSGNSDYEIKRNNKAILELEVIIEEIYQKLHSHKLDLLKLKVHVSIDAFGRDSGKIYSI